MLGRINTEDHDLLPILLSYIFCILPSVLFFAMFFAFSVQIANRSLLRSSCFTQVELVLLTGTGTEQESQAGKQKNRYFILQYHEQNFSQNSDFAAYKLKEHKNRHDSSMQAYSRPK